MIYRGLPDEVIEAGYDVWIPSVLNVMESVSAVIK
jgi:hypothetical protein